MSMFCLLRVGVKYSLRVLVIFSVCELRLLRGNIAIHPCGHSIVELEMQVGPYWDTWKVLSLFFLNSVTQ